MDLAPVHNRDSTNEEKTKVKANKGSQKTLKRTDFNQLLGVSLI
jgi:hypothetical protein